jgi:crotonobetaine/carnitine-CoA ligase
VPADLGEDDVKAFVVLAPGEPWQPHDLWTFVRGRLAAYKVPRFLEVLDELPHTPTGRLAKHRLPVERTATEIDFDARPEPEETR